MTGPYQVCPPLTADERDALEKSIADDGVLVPIVIDAYGAVIDGHHRKEIAARLGVPCPEQVDRSRTHDEKVALAITLNAARRQLDREQRRELLARSLKAQPEVSDREHARRTGVSPTTAGAVRDELEADDQLSRLDSRTGADGRTRTLPTKPAEHECTECGQHFKSEHWHCAGCDGHYPVGTVTACPACNPNAMVLDPDTGEVSDPPAPTTRKETPLTPEQRERLEADTAAQTSREVRTQNIARSVFYLSVLGAADDDPARVQAEWQPNFDNFGGAPTTVDRLRDAAAYLTRLADGWTR